MLLSDIRSVIPAELYSAFEKEGISELRPCQEKAINSGLLEGKNILVCTPTASGKTNVAVLAAVKNILEKQGKAIYIVPLKALATEKYKEFRTKYPFLKSAVSIGDFDSTDSKLHNYNFIVCTAEKLDSLIRHRADWVNEVDTVIIDEIHLMNDTHRGPTLEILITTLRHLLKNIQIIGLSATVGNEQELASWLNARLVHDTWRPVELKKGIYHDGEIEFYK